MSIAPYRKKFRNIGGDIRKSRFTTDVNDTGGKLTTGDAPWVANISANFRKKSLWRCYYFLGPWGKNESWQNMKQKISWHRSLFQGVLSLTVQIYVSLSNCFRILWTAPLYLGLFNFALWSRRKFLNFLNQIYIFHSRKFSRREKLPKYTRTTWEYSFVFIRSTASSAAPTLLLCRKMLGLNTEPESVND